MNNRQDKTSGMRLRERLIAQDECSIERTLINSLAEPLKDKMTADYIEESRAALAVIDKLKIAGQYESERERLAAILASERTELEIALQARMAALLHDEIFLARTDRLQNYLDGLRSSDAGQRARFQRFRDKEGLANRSLADVDHLLAVLEPAKRRKGRPKASPPWAHECAALDQMRLAVATGLSVAEAAGQAAQNEGKAHELSRAKYFARLFRARVKLRK